MMMEEKRKARVDYYYLLYGSLRLLCLLAYKWKRENPELPSNQKTGFRTCIQTSEARRHRCISFTLFIISHATNLYIGEILTFNA